MWVGHVILALDFLPICSGLIEASANQSREPWLLNILLTKRKKNISINNFLIFITHKNSVADQSAVLIDQ